MALEPRHFKDEIQELLDNRLQAEMRLEVEQHLEFCTECRQEMDALRWTKQFSRQHFAAEFEPAKLQANILAALDLEDKESEVEQAPKWMWWRQRRAILAYGFVLVVGVVMSLSYFILRERIQRPSELQPELQPELQVEVAQDYRNYKAEKLPLMLQTPEVGKLEKFFADKGIAFQTRVFDLAMMNYSLVGGRVHKLVNRQSALFVYRGKEGQTLVCQMYPGKVAELLPPGAILRENKGIQFYIYSVNGVTAAFWQEGDVTCVLASDIATEEVIQLAFAKAMRV